MKTAITVKNVTTHKALLAAPADRYAIWNKRLHIDDIFAELALPWDAYTSVIDIYTAIVAYCKENNLPPRAISWDVIDNVLYANDKAIKRVGPTHRYDHWTEPTPAEEAIYARQELMMPD